MVTFYILHDTGEAMELYGDTLIMVKDLNPFITVVLF